MGEVAEFSLDTVENAGVAPATLDELLRAEHVDLDRDEVFRSRLKVLMRSMWSRKNPAAPFGPGNKVPQGTVLLIGESGSGKSKTIEGALNALLRPDGTSLRSGACIVTMPSPYSSKGLARAIISDRLEADDVEIQTKTMTDAELWLMARRLMAETQVDILVVDEGARWATVRTVGERASEKELRILADNLNECAMFARWPVAVLVAGMPSVRVLWNTGALKQVDRRSKPFTLEKLAPSNEADIRKAMNQFATVVGVRITISDSATIESRVAHAADQLVGVAFEICREAVLLAAESRPPVLTMKHFEEAYRHMKDCTPRENVFAVKNFRNIKVRTVSSRVDLDEAVENETVKIDHDN